MKISDDPEVEVRIWPSAVGSRTRGVFELEIDHQVVRGVTDLTVSPTSMENRRELLIDLTDGMTIRLMVDTAKCKTVNMEAGA